MGEQRVFITAGPGARTRRAGVEKSVEEDDPYSLTGVRFPVADGVDTDRQIGLALVEEFALSGWSPGRIKGLFAAPDSGSMHDIHRRRGDQLVDELLTEVFGARRATEGHGHG